MSDMPQVDPGRTLDPYTLTVVDETLGALIGQTKWRQDAVVLRRAREAIADLGPVRSEPCS